MQAGPDRVIHGVGLSRRRRMGRLLSLDPRPTPTSLVETDHAQPFNAGARHPARRHPGGRARVCPDAARTFVSSFGSDANDCSRAAPCRTFQRAHDQTLQIGEITVPDPGGYGAVTITKSISIINDGVGEAGALVSGGFNGITINAGADDRVSLRGLTVKGIGFGGGNGIVFTAGRFLSIENCTIRKFTGTAQSQFIGHGIIFNPAGDSDLAISNTLVSDNEGHGISVVRANNGVSHTTQATFSFVQVYHSGLHGIVLSAGGTAGSINAAADNIVSSFNAVSGLAIEGSNIILLNVTRSMVSSNGTGFSSSNDSGTIGVGQSNVARNDITWSGHVFSYGDNYVAFNFDNNPAAPFGTFARK